MNKIILGSLLLFSAALISGAVYQAVATKMDSNLYPPPGQMVDVGGYKLHINCTGNGGPTVVLEAGMGGNSLEWSFIQPEVAKLTRVCSYDRAGNGWSDESPYSRTSSQIVEELHTLLTRAAIPGPYILVGHSFGGSNVLLYASRYPDEIAGVILVDAAHEDQFQKLPPMNTPLIERLVFHRSIARFLASVGAARLLNNLSEDHKIFPDPIPQIYSKLQSTVKFIGTIFEEQKTFPKSLAQFKNSNPHLGSKPLIVITAGRSFTIKECQQQGYSSDWLQRFDKARYSLQKDLLTKSLDSKQIIVQNCGHEIAREQPQVIIDAIDEMLKKSSKL